MKYLVGIVAIIIVAGGIFLTQQHTSTEQTILGDDLTWISLSVQDPNGYQAYQEKNGAIYYVPSNFEVNGADLKTFVVAAHTTGYKNSTDFAKDKNSVYDNGRILESADPNTFSLLFGPDNRWNPCYAKDATHIYFFCGMDSPYFVQGADAATFKLLSSTNNCPDASDKNHQYCRGNIVK